jgi:uncharacterized membrane protein
MARIEKNIEIDAPVTTVYNQWTQFEEFPLFMEGVEEVHQLDDERLQWVAQIGGKRKEWFARIVEQIPDTTVAWASEDGARNAGRVSFEPVDGDNRTKVNLAVDYEPEDIVETAGDKLGFVSRRVEGDLDRFKSFIEARGVETGAWRGTIR